MAIDLTKMAKDQAGKELHRLKVPMLDKRAEADLYQRGNSYDGRQARKARRS